MFLSDDPSSDTYRVIRRHRLRGNRLELFLEKTRTVTGSQGGSLSRVGYRNATACPCRAGFRSRRLITRAIVVTV